MKTCSKCGKEKALSDFYKDKNCKDGVIRLLKGALHNGRTYCLFR